MLLALDRRRVSKRGADGLRLRRSRSVPRGFSRADQKKKKSLAWSWSSP
jgi:hypothetical protein